jgi:DNA repair protein RecO (recombination protein O)
MLINSEGIVLRQRKIANNRRMIVLFTKKYGKISAGTSMNERGKGRSALALRPFTHAVYEIFRNRDYYNINGADVRESYYSVGEDIDRFMAASKLIEYLDAVLPEEQPQPKIFDLTIEFMETISYANGNYMTLLYAFIFKTLRVMGFMPEIRVCVDCGKSLEDIRKESNGRACVFSVGAGGILCESCCEREENDPSQMVFRTGFDIVDVIQYLVSKPLSVFEKVALKPQVSDDLRKILSEYLKYYLNVDVLDETMHL